MQPFEISQDIVSFLKEQWAGLFQLLLQEHARQKEVNLLSKIEATAGTLNQLVNFLTEERDKGDQAIKDILLSNHPAFAAIKKALDIPYRVFFENITEMESLFSARKTIQVNELEWGSSDYREYITSWFTPKKLFKIRADLFDSEGFLRIIKPNEWDDDYIKLEDIEETTELEPF